MQRRGVGSAGRPLWDGPIRDPDGFGPPKWSVRTSQKTPILDPPFRGPKRRGSGRYCYSPLRHRRAADGLLLGSKRGSIPGPQPSDFFFTRARARIQLVEMSWDEAIRPPIPRGPDQVPRD